MYDGLIPQQRLRINIAQRILSSFDLFKNINENVFGNLFLFYTEVKTWPQTLNFLLKFYTLFIKRR